MPWERRKRGGLYYTRNRSINGRKVREYIGRGPVAEMAAALDAQETQAGRKAKEKSRADLERFDAAEGVLRRLEGLAEAAEALIWVDAGYRPHRGSWRRSNGA